MSFERILGLVGFVISISMILIILVQNRKKEGSFPFLALVFLEAALYFVYVILPAGDLILKLILSFCPMFFGVPALYLFTRQSLNERAGRVFIHFLASLINIPLGLTAAVGLGRGMIPGSIVMVYLFIIISIQTLQLVLYGRKIYSLSREQCIPGLWIRRISLGVLIGYSLFVLLNWFFYVQELIFDVTGKLIVFLPGIEPYALMGFVMFIWTIGLSVLWGYQSFGVSDRKERYSGRSMDPAQAETILKKADALLGSLEYLDPDSINPRKLAELIDVPYYLLSRTVNEVKSFSVSDLIHTYRIGRSRELLETKPDLNVLEIAYESGFQSKSTFNTVFKTRTGLTPKEYREKKRND